MGELINMSERVNTKTIDKIVDDYNSRVCLKLTTKDYDEAFDLLDKYRQFKNAMFDNKDMGLPDDYKNKMNEDFRALRDMYFKAVKVSEK